MRQAVLPAVRGADLPVQLFTAGRNAGPLVLDAAHLHPVRNQDGFNVKPVGGLWTSSERPGVGSAWVEWCLWNQPDWVGAPGWNEDDPDAAGVARVRAFRLHPAADARIYRIDSTDDLARFVEAFPYRDRLSDFRGAAGLRAEQFPSWEAAGELWDAVHLTEEGQWRTRSAYPCNLYGWDCESTLWLRWAFERVEDLGEVTYSREER